VRQLQKSVGALSAPGCARQCDRTP
jgi:hypothetical protein